MTQMKKEQGVYPARNYKARMFEMIFRDKDELLKLYNAVNKTNYTDSTELEINTLDNAIYMSMKNDISFVIGSRVSLYEHQSTYNPNLPLRYLFYIADLYSAMTLGCNLYGTKMVKIPAPRFIVFYNGEEEISETDVLKLSEAYSVIEPEPRLELKAEFININPGYNDNLLNACKTLKDYSEYTARVREYAKDMNISNAVERAVTECIYEGILAEFLSKNRAEAIKVSLYEYDEEKQRVFNLEAGREEGLELGREEGLEIGREEGREIGREEGREIGREEGREIGREEGLEIGRKEGREMGREEGASYATERYSKLIQRLIEKNRHKELLKATEDAECLQRLYQEFNI